VFEILQNIVEIKHMNWKACHFIRLKEMMNTIPTKKKLGGWVDSIDFKSLCYGYSNWKTHL